MSSRRSAISTDHALAINDCLIAFVVACRESEYQVEVTTEYEFRSSCTSSTLIPDGIIELRRGSRRALLFLEVDLGTETRQTVQKKLTNYISLLHSGMFLPPELHLDTRQYRGFRTLIVVPSKQRLRSLKQVAARLPSNRIFWFSTITKVTAETVLRPIWEVPDDEQLHSLVKQPAGGKAGAQGGV